MKLSLERVDTRGLVLELPGTHEQSVAIAATENLRGTVAIGDVTMSLSGVEADAVVLSSLRLLLGSLLLSTGAQTSFERLTVTLHRAGERLDLVVTAGSAAAADLTLAIEDVTVRGRLHLTGVKLAVHGDAGSLSAEQLHLEALSLVLGDVEIAADAAHGTSVAIAWGPDGVRVAAGALEAPALRVVTPDAHVLASAVSVSALMIDDGRITTERATVGGVRVEARLGGTADATAASAAPRRPRRASRSSICACWTRSAVSSTWTSRSISRSRSWGAARRRTVCASRSTRARSTTARSRRTSRPSRTPSSISPCATARSSSSA